MTYENQDFLNYRDLLTRNYSMILQSSTVAEFPDLGDSLEYEEEMRIHERLFSGDPVISPDGTLVPAISSISLGEFRQLGEWAATDSGSDFPNAQAATFQVEILAVRPGFLDVVVQGEIEFYVVARDSVVDGVVTDYYQIVGQRDFTVEDKAGVLNIAWGSFKGVFF